jgi:hypothetical protein
MRNTLVAMVPAVMAIGLMAAAHPAVAGGGNFMSSCEAEVFATGERLGVSPNLYAPGTDGPNTVTAPETRFASGQPQARVLGLPGPLAHPAPPGETTDRLQILLTEALIAARRNNDFLCQKRVEDAVRVAGEGAS